MMNFAFLVMHFSGIQAVVNNVFRVLQALNKHEFKMQFSEATTLTVELLDKNIFIH